MIQIRHGSIFDSGAVALVNPVNCQGIMGAGLALQFARRFPHILAPYKRACAMKEMKPGTVLPIAGPPTVICLPTKIEWKNPSTLELVEEGCAALATYITEHNVQSCAVPALGCGLGGLQWPRVFASLKTALSPLACDVELYPPR